DFHVTGVQTCALPISVPATPPWSITDVFGHVAMEPARYRDLARGHGTWPTRAADLPEFNAEQVATLPTRDLRSLATILHAGLEEIGRASCRERGSEWG